jgi:glyoxylase I family protein
MAHNLLNMRRVHHIAIICSDYSVSRHFYTEVLGLEVLREQNRADRESWKCDLGLEGKYVIELFSFPDSPLRPTRPEACGLRHLCFAVDDLDAEVKRLESCGVAVESIRVDPATGLRYTFFADPDGLPLELMETTTTGR